MTRFRSTVHLVSALLATAASLDAQTPSLPPVRPLGPIQATVADSFKNVQGVLQLSDGRVIIHDANQRRVLLFDADLQHSRPIIDSTDATPRRYANQMDGPYRYRGDSTLLFDAGAEAMLVVDPAGTIARIVAPPVPQVSYTGPAGDGHAHLVFPGRSGMSHMTAADSARAAGGRPLQDSLPVMRADLATRHVDTVTYMWDQAFYLGTRGVDSCGVSYYRPFLNPIPSRDEWAVMSDGVVAVVRARDLHVDWIALDGSVTASPKLPYQWHRLTDTNKVALVDSIRKGLSRGGMAFIGGMRVDPNAPPACRAALAAAVKPDYPTPENMADYAAPFPVFGAVRADADDRVWIQTDANPAGGTGNVYLIVNRAGHVVDRVQIPGGTSIAGFGAGVVYLQSPVGHFVQVVRARIDH